LGLVQVSPVPRPARNDSDADREELGAASGTKRATSCVLISYVFVCGTQKGHLADVSEPHPPNVQLQKRVRQLKPLLPLKIWPS